VLLSVLACKRKKCDGCKGQQTGKLKVNPLGAVDILQTGMLNVKGPISKEHLTWQILAKGMLTLYIFCGMLRGYLYLCLRIGSALLVIISIVSNDTS